MPIQTSLAHYAILTAMLAPALFMTATGSLILSANNRLARIVDRLRVLVEMEDTDPVEQTFLDRQIERQRQRCNIILRAGRLLYLALSAFVGTSLSLAIDGATAIDLGLLPTGLAVTGVLLMLVACLTLSRESGMAMAAMNDEITHGHAQRIRRRGVSSG